jgi:hypothetical protein
MNLWRTYSSVRDFVLYDFRHGIRNLFKWFKIVWQDRDWDHYYILRVLQFKIRNTRILIDKNQTFAGCEEEVEKMKRCELLIQRLIDDNYAKEAGWKYEDVVWGENFITSKQTREELSGIFDTAYKNREAEKKELFDILWEHIESWWD